MTVGEKLMGLIAVLLLSTACSAQPPADDSGNPREHPSMTETDDPRLNEAIQQARADLAERTGADPAQIEVLEARPVTWPDGSLGCPEPGMMYTQALVEGVLIRLKIHGETHEYHGAAGREPFLCPRERVRPPA